MTQPETVKMLTAAEKSKASEWNMTGAPAVMGMPASVAPAAVTVGVQPHQASPEMRVKTRPLRVAGTLKRWVDGMGAVTPAEMVSLGIRVKFAFGLIYFDLV